MSILSMLGVCASNWLMAGPIQIYMYIPLYISSCPIHVGVILGMCVNSVHVLDIYGC